MKVTVLMTYFNKGPFVEEAVRSVLANSFSDFELLIVDDASTDGGLEAVRAIGDPRIRIIRHPVNKGRGAAANSGFEAAKGEYIAVLDADDIMLPERLAKQVAFMDSRPEVGISGGYLRTSGFRAGVLDVPVGDAGARAQVLFGMPVYYSCCIIRRSLLLSSGVRCDPNWLLPGMDHLFVAILGQYTQYANLPEVLVEYRLGEQNMRHGRDQWKDRSALVVEIFRVFGIPGDDGGPRYFCMLVEGYPTLPTALEVQAIHTWLLGLIALNAKQGWFDRKLFEAFLLRRWNALYHALPDHDPAAAWTHAWLTQPRPWARLRYLFKQKLRSVLKPAPRA